MGILTTKKATSHTPQVVTLIIDDSGSMQESSKAKQVTAAVQDLVITMQAGTQGAGGWRFLLNIGKFDNEVTPIAIAAPPFEIDLGQLVFTGERNGTTEMAKALMWGAQALEASLARCRQLPNYHEQNAPNPLCLFLSDGENTGADFRLAAQALKSIPFYGGNVDVVACGIGMQPAHFAVMQSIATHPNLAFNIDNQDVAGFIAEVGATALNNKPAAEVARNW